MTQATLTGARASNDPSALNVVKMVLTGSMDTGSGHPALPGFAGSLSDTEVAEVANYVTERKSTPNVLQAAHSKVTELRRWMDNPAWPALDESLGKGRWSAGRS